MVLGGCGTGRGPAGGGRWSLREAEQMTAEIGDTVTHVVDVLDALHCGALLVDRAGRIAHANPRVSEMLGRRAGELRGLTLRELYADGEAGEQVSEMIEDWEGTRDSEFFLPGPEGRRVPAVLSVQPPGEGSALSEYRVITVIDITKLKEVEEQTWEQYRQITRLSDTVLEQALELDKHSEVLEKRVRQRTRELAEANMDAIYMLAVASEAKDEDTGDHVLRIRDYSAALARAVGLADAEADRIGYSSILHDVGKIQVPDKILKKAGPLTPEERLVMEQHTVAGERILANKPFFELARQIARSHQENWDGSGYPDGLTGEEIPFAARIVRLADVFDALTQRRVYKPAWPLEQAIATIKQGAGTLFEPRLVHAFLNLVRSEEWAVVKQKQTRYHADTIAEVHVGRVPDRPE